MNSTYRYSSTSTSYSPILQASPRVSVHDSRSSSRHGSNSPHEHEEWFIEDEMVIFLVENCYFKIHKYFLQRDSQVFRDLFSCPCPPGSAEPEGKTKETAVVLPGVTKYEMSCLLKFLYHGMYDNHTTYPWRTSVAEWTALLSISTRYAFDRIRSRAIAALSPLTPTSTTSSYSTVTQLLDPVDMLVLAIKHDVPQWLEPAYVALCMREHPLEEEEGEKLGVGTCVRLAKARERYWREQAGRLEEDVRLGSNAGSRRFSVLLGQPPCPKRARATQIVHEVFWPAGAPPAAGVSEGGPMQI